MNKLWLSLAFIVLSISTITAQDFPGFRAGNFSGVNSVYFNPANIADSRYKYDINLFSFSSMLGNNQASFNLKSIGESFNVDSLKNKVFGDNAGPSSGLINFDVHGPSVMINMGNKSAIAVTTRARSMANIIDVDGKLLKSLMDDFSKDPQFPYTISSSQNMRMSVNAWAEIGASYGKVLFDKGDHFLKSGITVKYLGGVANGFVGLDRFNGTLNDDIVAQDVYMTNTTGRISTGFGGVEIDNIDLNKLLKFESSGLGADIGFVYEFRPDHEKYKTENGGSMKDRNKYKFKVGAALMDIGSIKYQKDMKRSGSYDINITGNNRFYLGQIADSSIDGYNAYFKSRPQYFTPASTNAATDYKVSLPTTLQLDFDMKIVAGFYTSFAAQIPLSKEETFNSRYYSSFTLTPRFEGKTFGIYMPINQNELTDFNAGLALRAGPFFIGSGSIISAVIGNSKQADFNMGFHISGLQKKQKKAKSSDSSEEK
jgi:hypothetical protein